MINNNLTTLYKNIIQSNGLVKTGNLLNSITVDITIINYNINVNINGADYLNVKDEEYDLTAQFLSSKEFEDEIGIVFDKMIEPLINQLMTLSVNNTFNFDINIKVNNKLIQ